MRSIKLAATLVAATFVLVACKDIPLLPKWNAAESVPLVTQRIALTGAGRFPAGASVPGGASVPVSFPADSQKMDGLIGQILQDSLLNGSLAIVITKSVVVSGVDTVFADSAQSRLNGTARIMIPVTISAPAGSRDSTLNPIGSAALLMLQNVAKNSGHLYLQIRGQATCPAPGPCTFQSSDSVTIKLQLLATVPISR